MSIGTLMVKLIHESAQSGRGRNYIPTHADRACPTLPGDTYSGRDQRRQPSQDTLPSNGSIDTIRSGSAPMVSWES
ncbi:uncharacterized protein METZ01_LOCUS270885, partial [marine metagenome]